MKKRIISSAVAGLAASALVMSSLVMSTGVATSADGTLELDPKEGTERTAFAVVTSAGCADERATHFIIKMRGSGLKEEVNLTGAAAIGLAGSTPGGTEPMRSISSQTFEMVKIDNGGSLPNGVYTITFQCRDRVSTTPLRSFSTTVTVTNAGGQVTWKQGGSPTPSALRNTKKPTISGKKAVGAKLRASAGSWQPRPDTVSYDWRIGKSSIGKGKSLKVPKSAKGKTITLRVTASKAGFTSTSVSVKVKIK